MRCKDNSKSKGDDSVASPFGLRSGLRQSGVRHEVRLGQLRLALAARGILEALLDRHAKDDCHFERGLKGRRILVLFDRNDRLPCDANSIGEFLLRHLPKGPEFSNLIADCGHQSALRYATICVAVFVMSERTNMPKKTLRK